MIYEGECIGGPEAGKWYCSASSIWRVEVMDGAPFWDGAAADVPSLHIKTVIYRHVRRDDGRGEWHMA